MYYQELLYGIESMPLIMLISRIYYEQQKVYGFRIETSLEPDEFVNWAFMKCN